MAYSEESLPSKPSAQVQFPAGLEIKSFYPGTGRESFACALSCVVSEGGLVIVLNTYSGRHVYLSSILVHSLLLHLQASEELRSKKVHVHNSVRPNTNS